MSYNSNSDCVKFTNIGSSCSTVSKDTIWWKNDQTAYTRIVAGDSICDCNIKEYVNTSANVSTSGSNFRLNITGLQNRCHSCTGSDMRIFFEFPLSGSTTSFPGCGATSDYLTISPTDFANYGYTCTAWVRYTTPWGVVINKHKFDYNGGGLSTSNVTVTTVSKKTIYKTISAKRKVTYTNGCPPVICTLTLAIPQQPNDPCTHFTAYISQVNLGSPCSGSGFSAVALNGVGSLTYQWYYNGSAISGQTDQYLCMVGRSDGIYCCEITDANGCKVNVCRIKQTACSLTVNITQSGGTLTANLTNCSGTASYQWQYWTGATWTNVGTSSSYNTGGVAGDYRVQVSCSGPPACSAIANYTYTPPCNADVTLSVGSTTITATVTGCGGTNIAYTWERWTGSIWTTVRTQSKTSTTDTYTPTVSGLYRVTIVCNGCSDSAQASFTMPDPCSGFSVSMTGTFTTMCLGDTRSFGRNISGGTTPYSNQWKLNGSNAGTGTTYSFTPGSTGSYTISITVTDANGCVKTDTKTVVVIVCCGVSTSISPASTSVCTNQDATFTATTSGGSSPYTYSWTSTLPPGPPIGQGSGSSKTLNFAVTGTYNIAVTVTDNSGCTAVSSATMTVTTCTDCTCTPTLSLSGCVLTGSFSGAGCANYSYQLQYSASGTGWASVKSGSAAPGGSFTHTPASNGYYRLVISASGCTLKESATIQVNCVVDCNCTAGTLTYSSCKFSWTNPCSGYVGNLYKKISGVWTFVTNTSPYNNPTDGDYRVTYQKSGCSDVNSAVVTVSVPICSYYQYYDEDYGGDIYIPKIAVPPHRQYSVGLPANTISAPATLGCLYNATLTNFTVAWGDGSYNNTGTGYVALQHTYSSTGTYKINYKRTTSLGEMDQDWYVYPDGTVNEPSIDLTGQCGDGAYPIFYTQRGCDSIALYILYGVTGINMPATTYTSHYVKINGTNYTVPIDFIQGAPNIYWGIYNTSPIVVPRASFNNYTSTIEVGCTINGSQVLKNKGYFRIECN